MKLCDLELAEPAREIVRAKRFLPKERWRPDRMEESRTRIQRHLSILEPQLAGREHLVGDRLSLADVCYAPLLQFLSIMEVEPGPAVAAWAARLVDRPSVRETRPAK
jgi:glutathione S-transferase